MNKKIYLIKTALLLVATIAVSLSVNCTCDSGGSTGPILTTNIALELVNDASEAWVDTYGIGDRAGFIFTDRGTFRTIVDGADGVGWFYTSAVEGGVAIRGAALDSLEILSDVALYPNIERGVRMGYAVSGAALDTLRLNTVDRTYIFVRTSGVVVSGNALPNVPYKSRK